MPLKSIPQNKIELLEQTMWIKKKHNEETEW